MPISGSTKALEYARLHVMRLGASRLDYYQPWFKVLIAGVDVTSHARITNCTINQELAQPHTMTLRVSGITPSQGQEIQVYMGDTTVSHQVFGGHILNLTTAYESTIANVAYDLSCIDYSWRLGEKTVLGTYANIAADVLVKTLMATYAPWATTNNVVSGLPVISSIAFTNQALSDCLTAIAQAIGGYSRLDYGKDLHFFITDTSGSAQPVTDAHLSGWSLDAQDSLGVATDLSQIRTRAIAVGQGKKASAAVPAGGTTIPVEDGSIYAASGGVLQVGTQRLSYTGKSTMDGQGGLTAGTPGSAPSPPSPAQATPFATGNLAAGGNYGYVVTFVSAAGESVASSSSTATIAAVGNAAQPSMTDVAGGSMAQGFVYAYMVTFVTAAGEAGYVPDTLHMSSGPLNNGSGHNSFSLTNIPTSSDARVTKRKIYRSHNAGGWQPFQLVTTINDNTTTTFTDTLADASLGATMPTTDTASTGQIAVGIPTGPTGTTGRKLYRTVLGGSTFKLQSTTSDNTTTSVTDNTADASLGATLASGTIGASPGDTTLAVTDLTKFPASGWVRFGSQVILYTGRSATSGAGNLTGIPASGSGAITASIPAGSTVTNEPTLSGVPASGTGAVTTTINAGDTVSIRVETNDTTAQATLATLIGGSDDGIVETVLSNSAWDLTTCAAEGAAELSLYKNAIASLKGTTRDQSVRLGRSVSFTLTNPPVNGSFQVQRVQLSDVAIAGGSTNYVFPLRTVDGSTVRQTFENLLATLLQKTS